MLTYSRGRYIWNILVKHNYIFEGFLEICGAFEIGEWPSQGIKNVGYYETIPSIKRILFHTVNEKLENFSSK